MIKKNNIKILFTGLSNSGKSSILSKYLYNKMSNNMNKTEFNLLKYHESNVTYRFQIWNTLSILKQYYTKAQIIVFVFDITNLESLKHFDIYLKKKLLLNNQMIIFIGNKYDLKNHIPKTYILKYIANSLKDYNKINFNYYNVSALTSYNINNLFNFIIKYCINHEEDNILETINNNKNNIYNRYNLCC